jgi:DNA polymerase III delta subunit
MAQTYLRSADFARACTLCENAWRSGQSSAALISTWQEACRQWAAVSPQAESDAARQQTMRQLSIASSMR